MAHKNNKIYIEDNTSINLKQYINFNNIDDSPYMDEGGFPQVNLPPMEAQHFFVIKNDFLLRIQQDIQTFRMGNLFCW